jgi:hypothetical protein
MMGLIKVVWVTASGMEITIIVMLLSHVSI